MAQTDIQNDVQNALNYYRTTLSASAKELVAHYKAEMEPDDWIEKPLKISYVALNWALKNKKTRVAYTPELISSGAVTPAQLEDQVKHGKALSEALERFPRIKSHAGITVYRGKPCGSIQRVPIGADVTMYNFLSTSLNLAVATRFSERGEHPCLMRINLPKGNPLPFVGGGEQEVLLPSGSTFTLKAKNLEHINGRNYTVYDFTLLRFGSIKTRGDTPPATQALTPRTLTPRTLTPRKTRRVRRGEKRKTRRKTNRRK